MLEATTTLVEVIGVAGAGKSTLVGHLTDANANAHRADFIQVRNPDHLVQVTRSLPRLAPILVRNLFTPPRLSWAEFKLLAYVSQWWRVLDRSGPGVDRLLLLDQGPLYCLVRLEALGKGVTNTKRFDRFRNEMVKTWGDVLDAVIWLDAGDDVLLERINQREQTHGTKGQELDVARVFLTRYRDLFKMIVELLKETGGPPIIEVDTSESSSTEIAALVRSHLDDILGRSDLQATGQESADV